MSLRLNDEELAALRRAAADDKRQPAALARLILTDWLISKGYLSEDA